MKRSPSSVPSRARGRTPLEPARLAAALREAAEHRVARRDDEAIALYAHVEQHNPEALDAPYFLALIDLAQGRLVEAQARLERLSRRLPDERKIWSGLVYVRTELGQWTAVLEALDQIERLAPAEPQIERATALEVLGRIDEAVAFYRRLSAVPAMRLPALIGLASLKPGAITAGEKAEIAEAARSSDADDHARPGLYFALGEIEERAGDTDAAFAAFVAGNRLRRQMLTGERPRPEPMPIEPPVRMLDPDQAAEQQRGRVAFRKAVFTHDFMAEYAGRGHHIAAPIFIVGMPRSGSTLLEQILSSHRRVQGLGETTTLSDVVRDKYPLDLFAPNPPNHFRAMAEAYFKAMHARGWGSAPRFVDKALTNYMDIGLVHLMTPKAVILHSLRDPVDTCLACYRKFFRTGNEATYDLGDIGREYVRYREMMDHWTEVLPGRVIDVSHEALVADPDRQIRWLITEACGLAWDPACPRFYETRRPVRTASVAQVRQPIFTTSVERWRRYEKHLGPLFDALGPYAPATGMSGHAD
ncbi:MAG TPA: sulfotransferase [Caulobacteraceae bacterium]|nr:sulfotransferase [Caulobacteraceae bacterium]